jgi:hypothetical protein
MHNSPSENPRAARRRCSRCRRTKALDNFVKQPSHPGGRSYHCKRCAADRVRAWRKAQREVPR